MRILVVSLAITPVFLAYAAALCNTASQLAMYIAVGRTLMKPEPWVSLEEIAEHLGVSMDTVHRWIRARKMPAHKVGHLWRFRASEVDAWVMAGKAGTGRDVREGRAGKAPDGGGGNG
jgi:excisionase family DNA binding protein